ncbi:MAG: Holliday junction branch migration protein RuvA [Gammaproteobacteria bacterium]|nr:MAG: Holliday junction branch migration protein RuvA [Gammaproteobacteria bacterium]
MIGWLRGELREKESPYVLIDVNGVGYEVEAPTMTFSVLPDVGKTITLYTHLQVREDAHNLYGFSSETERNVFRLLLKVSGVGAKLALAILSGMDAASFARCVYEGDTVSLARLPGIGKKTAERLVMEMSDRLERSMTIPRVTAAAEATVHMDPVREAVNALISLGFRPQEASARVQTIETTGLASDEIVRRALRADTK